MTDILTFMGEHPILTFFLAVVASGVVKAIIRLPLLVWRYFLRHLSVRKAGWPPSHLDADGDFRPSGDQS